MGQRAPVSPSPINTQSRQQRAAWPEVTLYIVGTAMELCLPGGVQKPMLAWASPAAMACTSVTWPMPLVTPSRNSSLAPTFRYSGCFRKRKRTTAFSPVRSLSCSRYAVTGPGQSLPSRSLPALALHPRGPIRLLPTQSGARSPLWDQGVLYESGARPPSFLEAENSDFSLEKQHGWVPLTLAWIFSTTAV